MLTRDEAILNDGMVARIRLDGDLYARNEKQAWRVGGGRLGNLVAYLLILYRTFEWRIKLRCTEKVSGANI